MNDDVRRRWRTTVTVPVKVEVRGESVEDLAAICEIGLEVEDFRMSVIVSAE